MNRILLVSLFLSMACLMQAQSMERLLLSGWRFSKGSAQGAERPDYDDSSWEKVSIPHDWAISGPFDKNIDMQSVLIVQNGESSATEKTGRTGSLPWIGEGWYRTTLEIPEGYGHAELQFDGAMAQPSVFIDGKLAGHWAYGYGIFTIDITDYVLGKGKTHTLAVHLDNVSRSSRWYPGAGIYRPVRLLLGQKTGLKTWGIFARTTRVDDIDSDGQTAKSALVSVNTQLRHEADAKVGECKIINVLLSPDGKEVARGKSAPLSDSYESAMVLAVNNPKLWSPEHPVLYTLVTEVEKDGKVIDRQETRTGIRKAEFADDGFRLNGILRKFKGVCLHHDLGPLGSAFYKAAFRRQVKLLKDIGCDAIRTSHNIPAPWQMDICDEMGMMVMAESFDMWVYPKCENGSATYFEKTDTESPNADGRPWWKRDFENLVLANRNHPSIVMWSIGNEVPDQTSAVGLKYTRAIQNLIASLDPTRPCTQGMNSPLEAAVSGVFQATDIQGMNYHLFDYRKGKDQSPRGLILGSETASTISSRGVYKFPVTENHSKADADGQVSSYDMDACSWSNIPDDDWMWQDKAPWVIGEFVWTGFDYLGEPTPYDEYWPSRSSYFGIYDLAGIPKDRAYLYRVHWAPEKETVHVLPHWSWKGREGQVTPVFCYTNYPEADLFINGKSQGRRRHIDLSLDEYERDTTFFRTPWGYDSKTPNPDAPENRNRLNRYRLRWMDTVYEPGELKVVVYDKDGNKAGEKIIRTASKPHHLELEADRASISRLSLDESGNLTDTPDLCFVTVSVVDKDGNLCPDADSQLSFSVKGAARFNSCCNGDATSTETFVNPSMKAFKGKLVVVLEAGKDPGQAVLTVSGKGIKPQSVTIDVK